MMPKTDQESKFYKGIEDYLEETNTAKTINTKGLEELIFKVQIKTGLSLAESESIIQVFFQELRNLMLQGEIVNLKELGKFFISSPVLGNKQRIFPKFKLLKHLIKKINDTN